MRLFVSTLFIFILSGCGGGGGSDETSQPISSTPINNAPLININDNFTVFEGDTFSQSISISDIDGDTVTLSLSGPSANYFSITNRELSLNAPIDYESLIENGSNTLNIIITASDGSIEATQSVAVLIKNAIEGRVVDGPIEAARVFLDKNANFQLDDDEIFVESNEQGYFILKDDAEGDFNLIALGGVDSVTNVNLADSILIFPHDNNFSFANLNAVSTLVALSSIDAVQNLFGNTSNSLDVNTLLQEDTWAKAENSSEIAQKFQVVNIQILSLLNAGKSIYNQNTLVITELLAEVLAQSSNEGILNQFTDVDITKNLLIELGSNILNSNVPESLIDLVAQSVSGINQAVQDNQGLVTRQEVTDLFTLVQQGLPQAVIRFISEEINNEVFIEQFNEIFQDLGIDNVLLDPSMSLLDSDSDGVINENDAFPYDPRNFTDSDADGVFDMFDAAPNNALIDNAFIFNLDEVTDTGVSESLRDSDTGVIVFKDTYKKVKSWFTSLTSWFVSPAIADEDSMILLNQNNLVNWNNAGQEINDAILSSRTFFAAEAVLSPNGKNLYYVTSPEMQSVLKERLGLDDEWCQLYKVALEKERTFNCVLEVSQAEIQPMSISLVWRNDFQRQAMSFRADGTAVVNTSSGPRLITLEGELVAFEPSRQAPGGFSRAVDNIVWLDDEHVAVTFSIYPENGGATTSYWAAFNVTSGIEVDEVTFSDFRITKDGQRFIGTDGALSWNGSQFSVAQGVSNAVVDSFGNLWQKESVYGLALTDLSRGLELSLGEANTNGPNIYIESGTGTRIRYRDFAFSDQWVASKYSMLAKDTINTIAGEEYKLLQPMHVELEGQAGSFIKLTDPDLWYYVRSGTETGDVTINYEVTTAAGIIEQRSYVLPFEIIQNMAVIDSTIYDPSEYNNGYELLEMNGEGVSIEIPNPEAERSSFCVFKIISNAQRCAELTNYKSVRYDYENIRNSQARYPDNYYVCPDQSCSAPPGVQNVLIAGDRVIAYFKDSVNNRYYKAEGALDSFMLEGDDALTFEEVVNGAGESQIIASANQIKASAQAQLTGASATFENNKLSINFSNPISKYAELPVVVVKNSEGVKMSMAGEAVFNSDYTQIDVTMMDEDLFFGESYEVSFENWLFEKDSPLRLALEEPLLAILEGNNSFVIDVDTQLTLTDYDPATGDNYNIVTGFTMSNGALIADLSTRPINKQNIDNALNGDSFKVPTVSLTLDQLAIANDTMELTVTLIDGNDSKIDVNERVASLSFNLNWESNGVSATFSVPIQTADGNLVTSRGVSIDVSVENLDPDIISLTAEGVNYPTTMEIKLLSVLNKLAGLLPNDLLRSGTYTAVIEFTGLPLETDSGNVVDSLVVHFTIEDN